MGACMFRASVPAADASDTSLRTGVEDNLAHRLRATAMEGRRAYDAIHRGFHIYRAGQIVIPIIPWGYVFRHYLKKPGARWH